MRPGTNPILAAIRIVTIGAIASIFLLAPGPQAQSPPPRPYCALGLEVLTPTEGFDLTPYVKRLLPVVMRNGEKQTPADAKMGGMGAVAVLVTIQKDGTLARRGPDHRRRLQIQGHGQGRT